MGWKHYQTVDPIPDPPTPAFQMRVNYFHPLTFGMTIPGSFDRKILQDKSSLFSTKFDL